ncbi:hypothetical protein BJ912DRAFT_344653 [Pholiota molesta]|nr:hypothetical protein BJ912DRAFT_344653 [Pholiota molesta]
MPQQLNLEKPTSRMILLPYSFLSFDAILHYEIFCIQPLEKKKRQLPEVVTAPVVYCRSGKKMLVSTLNLRAANLNGDTSSPKLLFQSSETTISRLPTYEEATTIRDVTRLPSYRVTRPSSRFHPYRYKVPILVDGTGMDRLFNTVYDEEYVRIQVPPAPVRPVPTQPLVAIILQPNLNDAGANQHIVVHAPQPDPEEFDRRRQNVAAVILQEFVAASSCRRHRTNPQASTLAAIMNVP